MINIFTQSSIAYEFLKICGKPPFKKNVMKLLLKLVLTSPKDEAMIHLGCRLQSPLVQARVVSGLGRGQLLSATGPISFMQATDLVCIPGPQVTRQLGP